MAIQFRRGTAAALASLNETLARGQPCWEIDTNRLKMGDGTTAFNSLPYLGADPEGWMRIVSAADFDVVNAGLTDHTNFQFAVAAGGFYMLDLALAISGSDAAADAVVAFEVSAGTMNLSGKCESIAINLAANSNLVVTANAAAASSNMSVGVDALDFPRPLKGVVCFSCTSAGTFKLRFGNNIPTSGATSRLLQGSIMRWKRLK